MSGLRPVNDDIRKAAFEKTAQVKIYQLHLMAQIIDLAMSRGAFKGGEASQVGALFDSLVAGINKAYDMVENEVKKIDEIKLPSISENKIE